MAKRSKKIVQRDPFGRELSTWEEEEADDGIVADGQRVRVPMWAMDSLQKSVAQDRVSTEDKLARSFGLNDALDLHRPGFRRVTDASALAAVEQAYRDADERDRNAYKNLQGDKSGENRGQPEGDQCTINGAPGHLPKVCNKFECVPDNSDAQTVADAYAEYDREAENAWRK